MTLPPGDAAARTLRYLRALQRTRLWMYGLATVVWMVGEATGVSDLSSQAGAVLFGSGILSSLLMLFLISRGAHLSLPFDINWLWLVLDSATVTCGVYLTGGLATPVWFVWYLSNTSAAAFAGGVRMAAVVAAINTVAYFGALVLKGQIRGLDTGFGVALCQLVLLYGASAFSLRGVARLARHRQELQELREDERLKVEELIRLTQDLDQGTRALAEANLEIREADRVKSQFLANMSHELRTPLNSIIGFSEILMERLAGQVSPKHHKFLANIHSSGQHLLAIINDILDLSKVEAGKMDLHPEEFRLPIVIDSVLTVMHAMASKQRITFEVEVPDAMPPVCTDPARLKQILYNLLSNAVKFSPEGSRVQIVARFLPAPSSPLSCDAFAVSVIDQGIGIAAADREVIFQEFRQVDGTATRLFGGTGLGLAIVKKFVTVQGGTVTLETEPGQGSTFTVTLPLQPAAPAEDSTPSLADAAPALSFAQRILVVEDDVVAYQSLSRCLSDAGYFPIRARLGAEALHMARSLRPTAITLDLTLPDLSGWDVLKELKREAATKDIPVVIISMSDNRELGLTLGAADYFVKPVDRERLTARLRELAPVDGPLGGHLLLVDDDPAIHDLLDEELVPLGYTVHHAYTGTEGIARARRDRPDAVILDILMPDVTGFDVADALQERLETANVPIVILTAKDLTRAERTRLQGKIRALVRKGHGTKPRLLAAIRDLEAREGARGR